MELNNLSARTKYEKNDCLNLTSPLKMSEHFRVLNQYT